MPGVDGRSIGGTGEFRGDNTPEQDIDRIKVDMEENIGTLECERGRDDSWFCEINGQGVGYQNRPARFDSLSLPSRAKISSMKDGDEILAQMDPAGDCEIDRTPYQQIDGDTKLVCR